MRSVADKFQDTRAEIESFKHRPGVYYDHRMALEQKLAGGFRGLWKGTSAQAQFTAQARSFMESSIRDPSLQDALIPDFEAGCRRFTPGGHYLRALQESNITPVRDNVVRLTQNAVITQTGKSYPCDIVVFATGFEPYQPRFPVIGRDGYSLNECWHPKGPCESYMAAMVAGFPNFFGQYDILLPVGYLAHCCSIQSPYLSRQRIGDPGY